MVELKFPPRRYHMNTHGLDSQKINTPFKIGLTAFMADPEKHRGNEKRHKYMHQQPLSSLVAIPTPFLVATIPFTLVARVPYLVIVEQPMLGTKVAFLRWTEGDLGWIAWFVEIINDRQDNKNCYIMI